jgi:hypothetical protein
MKFSMTGQEKGDILIKVTTWTSSLEKMPNNIKTFPFKNEVKLGTRNLNRLSNII